MNRLPIITRIREALRGSLLTRFTAVFLATVLVPTLAILTYSIVTTSRSTRESVLATSESIANDVFASVADAFDAGAGLAEQITLVTTLRDHLAADFPETGDAVVSFLTRVRPLIDYAVRFRGGDIEDVRIVTHNPTHPESWPYFVSERRMLDAAWFRSFLESDEPSTWIYPNESGVYSSFAINQIVRRPAYTHARKIYSVRGEYLGCVLVDVLEASVHDAMRGLALESMGFSLLGADGTFRRDFSADARPLSGREAERWRTRVTEDATQRALAAGSLHSGRYTYLWRRLSGPDLIVSARVDARSQILESAWSKILVGVVVVLGVVGLEIGTYLILNQSLRRLSTMTRVMNRVADGEFDHRIPVETHDEIGQIAKDFNILIRRIDDLVSESIRRETLQKDTQLKALQFQINPHFIYNTIDAFRMRCEMAGEEDLADALASFGKLIRYNMAGDSLFAPLADELDVVERYVQIEVTRSAEELELVTRDAQPQRQVPVLRFLLQPIVENCIRHGRSDRLDRSLTITVSAEVDEEYLTIAVADDGRGMSIGRLAEVRRHLQDRTAQLAVDGENGIGLGNIAGRLALHYEGRASIAVDSTEGVATVVTIRVPVEVSDDDCAYR
ncbi:MAG: histidine kinase [Spirochaetota bacterium]